ncbi:MAG TPA: hypothetical protein ENI20_02425 [Bacteroides sp.]|nr:hypothetical protein [Bacteroides sp.]
MKVLSTFFSIIVSLSLLGAQNNSPDGQVRELFSSDSMMELTIFLELDSIRADVGEDPSYHDAVLEFNDPIKSLTRIDIKVRARGSFRKNPANCDFPLLKLKFDKTDRKGSIFENIKDIKLVTHCQSGESEFEQFVLQEYLIYKGYNLFTDFSFRVRLARITYVNTSADMDSLTRFAFMIEDVNDMAERNNGEILEISSAPADRLDQHHFLLMSMYNYMIHNTDFSASIVHNLELVSLNHFQPPVPVPYDFDWSGIIDIPYDSPYANNATRYTGRRYKGPCLKRKEFEEIFIFMKENKRSLYDNYWDFPFLDEEIRARIMHELNLFYITIDNPNLVRQEFVKNCVD